MEISSFHSNTKIPIKPIVSSTGSHKRSLKTKPKYKTPKLLPDMTILPSGKKNGESCRNEGRPLKLTKEECFDVPGFSVDDPTFSLGVSQWNETDTLCLDAKVNTNSPPEFTNSIMNSPIEQTSLRLGGLKQDRKIITGTLLKPSKTHSPRPEPSPTNLSITTSLSISPQVSNANSHPIQSSNQLFDAPPTNASKSIQFETVGQTVEQSQSKYSLLKENDPTEDMKQTQDDVHHSSDVKEQMIPENSIVEPLAVKTVQIENGSIKVEERSAIESIQSKSDSSINDEEMDLLLCSSITDVNSDIQQTDPFDQHKALIENMRVDNGIGINNQQGMQVENQSEKEDMDVCESMEKQRAATIQSNVHEMQKDIQSEFVGFDGKFGSNIAKDQIFEMNETNQNVASEDMDKEIIDKEYTDEDTDAEFDSNLKENDQQTTELDYSDFLVDRPGSSPARFSEVFTFKPIYSHRTTPHTRQEAQNNHRLSFLDSDIHSPALTWPSPKSTRANTALLSQTLNETLPVTEDPWEIGRAHV